MRLVIISGGSKGLGQALCNTFLEHDWTVREFSRSAPEDYSVACDFADREATTEIVGSTFESLSTQPWSQIVLINNAATLQPIGPLADSAAADWLQHVDINIAAALLCCGLFAKHFQSHSASKCIAHISSGAARRDVSGWSLYCASKAALERFSGCMALEQEQQKHPIHSVVINPGVMDTGMQETIRAQSSRQFADVDRFRALHAADQLVPPQRVAAACYRVLQAHPVNGSYHDVKNQL